MAKYSLELRELFDRLYISEEYKMGVNPVLSYDMSDVVGIYESGKGSIQEVKADAELQKRIFETYYQ